MRKDEILEPWSQDDIPGSSVISFRQARELAGKHGTPTLLCDLHRVEANYDQLKGMIPGAELYYAVKANPLPEILETLVEKGSRFDVASKNEIRMCLDAGAIPDKLMYANPIKPAESIRFAYENGVRTFTYDSAAEVEKMAKNAPGSNVILRVAARDVGSHCKFSTKFGAREAHALGLLRKAKSAGLNPVGLSFHVGSQCTRMENYSRAIKMCSRIISLAKRKGIGLSVLDIGGGIPIKYVGDVYSFEDLSSLLNKELEEQIPRDVQIIMEPGRPMVGSSMTLITTVIGTSKRGAWDCLYLDDGVYNSLSERVFGHCQYRIVSDKKGKLRKYKVFGPTCDSMDIIAKGSYLQEQKEGDLLLVLNAGAYTNSAATHFNGFDPAKIVFI